MEKKEIDNKKIRFSDAPWANAIQHIVVGGVGGIGSWLAIYLSRIGHILYLYDMDIIDETNMGGQLYSLAQIGTNKAEATKANIILFSGAESNVSTYTQYDEDSGFVTPIMCSCFDNMAARKLMFEKWAAYDKRELFVDGRMLAEIGMVFTVQKGQEEEYRKSLFEDSEVEEAPCSFKSTSHCGALISSLMVSNLNNYLANKTAGNNDRYIPFKFDFALPMMFMSGEELPIKVSSEEKQEIIK
jgi:molybdopterin/thiamine biosynthesis adenylyltransferase